MSHTTQKKFNLIFGKMSSADFYPKGKATEIDIIISAPKDTKIFAGNVVIMDEEIYNELLEASKDLLNIACEPGNYSPLDEEEKQTQEYLKEKYHTAQKRLITAIAKAEDK